MQTSFINLLLSLFSDPHKYRVIYVSIVGVLEWAFRKRKSAAPKSRPYEGHLVSRRSVIVRYPKFVLATRKHHEASHCVSDKTYQTQIKRLNTPLIVRLSSI